MGKALRIIFMGTPEFAVSSLQALHESGYTPVTVVTSPDKPAGRGLKMHQSPVKQFALANSIPVVQPENMKDPAFLEQMKSLSPDVIVVVAFRKIPDELLAIPFIGSFNLHASLLPQYRGAAPINRAIINGETETGVTTFLLNNSIDTGKILFREKVSISESQTASELHDVLMKVGADLVIKTVNALKDMNYQTTDQNTLLVADEPLKKAPKLKKEDCRICWNQKGLNIYNFIRGLSQYPGAYTELISPKQDKYYIKVLGASYEYTENTMLPGNLETDASTYVRISCPDGYLYLKQVQLAGKKAMNIGEFLRGFKLSNHWTI